MHMKKFLSSILALGLTASATIGVMPVIAADAKTPLTFDICTTDQAHTYQVAASKLQEYPVTIPVSIYVPSNPGVNAINLKLQVEDGQIDQDNVFHNYDFTLTNAALSSPYCFDSANEGNPEMAFSGSTFNGDSMNIVWVASNDVTKNADSKSEAGTTAWDNTASWAYDYSFAEAQLVIPTDLPVGTYKLDIRKEQYVNAVSSMAGSTLYSVSRCKSADSAEPLDFTSIPLVIEVIEANESTTETTVTTTQTTSTTEETSTTKSEPTTTETTSTTEGPTTMSEPSTTETTSTSEVTSTTKSEPTTTQTTSTTESTSTTKSEPTTTQTTSTTESTSTTKSEPTTTQTTSTTESTSTTKSEPTTTQTTSTTESTSTTKSEPTTTQTTSTTGDTSTTKSEPTTTQTTSTTETTSTTASITTTSEDTSSSDESTVTTTSFVETGDPWVEDYAIENAGHYMIIGDVCGAPGEKVRVPVYVYGDTGTAGMGLYFTYDSALAMTDMRVNNHNRAYLATPTLNADVYPAHLIHANSKEEVAADGAIVIDLVFQIPEDAVEGTCYDIGFTHEGYVDEDGDKKVPTVVDLDGGKRNVTFFDGSVTVVNDKNIMLNRTSIMMQEPGYYVNLTLFNTTGSVKWTTSDPEVATVDQNGFVVATGLGNAEITASHGGKNYVCNVMVGLFGDVNQNGRVAVDDALEVMIAYADRLALKPSPLTEVQLMIADVNGDDKADVNDALCIMIYYTNQLAMKDYITWYDITGNPNAPGAPK